MRLVQVGYDNTSDPKNEKIDPSLLKNTGENAELTGRLLDGSEDHGFAEEWKEPAILPDGRNCYRVYLFTAEEVSEANDEDNYANPGAENYPWDDAHVRRIVLDPDAESYPGRVTTGGQS